MEQQAKQLIYSLNLTALEVQKELATLEALLLGEYKAITHPPEGSILHPEYQAEQDIKPEQIPY
jgi:hypothetical protein